MDPIAVALSGGVDSAYAALKIMASGKRIFGVFMDLGLGYETLDRAKYVASVIGIILHVVSLKEQFHELVIKYFIDEYARGRTPNPCAICNKKVKFGLLMDRAESLGAQKFATGHYACIRRSFLYRARDLSKDQSYFLCLVDRNRLDSVEFPLCEEKKEHVVKSMQEMGIRSYESQEICFLSGLDYRVFLKEHLGKRPGRIVDTSGKVLGEHEGIYLFTVGQRRGLGISLGRPVYVVSLVPEENLVVLGSEEELYFRSMRVEDMNWYERKDDAFYGWVKIRHQHVPARARIYPDGRVYFDEPQRAITPGQVACIYDNDGKVVAGGIISCVL